MNFLIIVVLIALGMVAQPLDVQRAPQCNEAVERCVSPNGPSEGDAGAGAVGGAGESNGEA
jgi:hypothetical protein